MNDDRADSDRYMRKRASSSIIVEHKDLKEYLKREKDSFHSKHYCRKRLFQLSTLLLSMLRAFILATVNVVVYNFNGTFTTYRFFTLNVSYGLGLAFFGNIVDNIIVS